MEQNLEPIRSKIYEIRGQRVMLDRDLAELQPREPKLGKRDLLLIVSFKIIKYQIEY